MNEAINYDKLARRIAHHLNEQASKELWTADECATYIKKSKMVFSNRISKHPKFPKPVTLPQTDGRRTHPIWYAAEVKDWVEKQR